MMDENPSGRTQAPLSAPSSAVNIQRYLDGNLSGSATSVVLQVDAVNDEPERSESTPDRPAATAVDPAVARI